MACCTYKIIYLRPFLHCAVELDSTLNTAFTRRVLTISNPRNNRKLQKVFCQSEADLQQKTSMTLSCAVPGLFFDDDAERPLHASLTYRDVKAVGPPAQPLEFPTPTVHRAVSVSGLVLDHRQPFNSRVYEIHNALTSRQRSETQLRNAYLFKKTIAKTAFGCIKLCEVLRSRHSDSLDGCDGAEWMSTDEMVAIKASSKSKIRQRRGQFGEDPMKGGFGIWRVRSCIPTHFTVYTCVCWFIVTGILY